MAPDLSGDRRPGPTASPQLESLRQDLRGDLPGLALLGRVRRDRPGPWLNSRRFDPRCLLDQGGRRQGRGVGPRRGLGNLWIRFIAFPALSAFQRSSLFPQAGTFLEPALLLGRRQRTREPGTSVAALHDLDDDAGGHAVMPRDLLDRPALGMLDA